ncbi:MAG TPA: S8 family serine peptidase, partial [Longimicrobiales bacterium]|nr:S8 family serine peptidase [Longimicrobiales bacterium]
MASRTRAGAAATLSRPRTALVRALGCGVTLGCGLALVLLGSTLEASPAIGSDRGARPALGGDSVAVWILFHAAPADGARLPPALSPEALALRRARGIPLRPDDHPLPPSLVSRVRSAGARIRHESRWLRGVSAWVDPASLGTLAALPEVRGLAPVERLQRLPARAPAARPSPFRAPAPLLGRGLAPADSADYGLAWAPLSRLNVPAAHDLGFTGAGVRMAILDTGFDPDHESLAPLTLLGARDYIGGDDEVRSEPGEPLDAERHGTWIWSLAGAAAPGELLGPAYGASWLLAKVDDVLADPRADEDRWVAALEWADSMGVQVVISAVSFRRFDDGFEYPFATLNGDAAIMTQAADRAALRGMLVVTQVGDEGPGERTLGVPADADSVLAVGAVDSAGRPLLFSARGPTADGRLKPEVVAPGSDLWAASAEASDEYDRLVLGGTGLATALVGGGAALVWEAWPTFGPMDVREALIRSGDRAHTPESGVGHGVPDIGVAILFPRGFDLTRTDGLDDDGQLSTLSPRFHFEAPLTHPLTGQVTYVLELSPDTTFRDILFSRAEVDVGSMRLLDPLRPGTR